MKLFGVCAMLCSAATGAIATYGYANGTFTDGSISQESVTSTALFITVPSAVTTSSQIGFVVSPIVTTGLSSEDTGDTTSTVIVLGHEPTTRVATVTGPPFSSSTATMAQTSDIEVTSTLIEIVHSKTTVSTVTLPVTAAAPMSRSSTVPSVTQITSIDAISQVYSQSAALIVVTATAVPVQITSIITSSGHVKTLTSTSTITRLVSVVLNSHYIAASEIATPETCSLSTVYITVTGPVSITSALHSTTISGDAVSGSQVTPFGIATASKITTVSTAIETAVVASMTPVPSLSSYGTFLGSSSSFTAVKPSSSANGGNGTTTAVPTTLPFLTPNNGTSTNAASAPYSHLALVTCLIATLVLFAV